MIRFTEVWPKFEVIFKRASYKLVSSSWAIIQYFKIDLSGGMYYLIILPVCTPFNLGTGTLVGKEYTVCSIQYRRRYCRLNIVELAEIPEKTSTISWFLAGILPVPISLKIPNSAVFFSEIFITNNFLGVMNDVIFYIKSSWKIKMILAPLELLSNKNPLCSLTRRTKGMLAPPIFHPYLQPLEYSNSKNYNK